MCLSSEDPCKHNNLLAAQTGTFYLNVPAPSFQQLEEAWTAAPAYFYALRTHGKTPDALLGSLVAVGVYADIVHYFYLNKPFFFPLVSFSRGSQKSRCVFTSAPTPRYETLWCAFLTFTASEVDVQILCPVFASF